MSEVDRGTERRRLLEAVRQGDGSQPSPGEDVEEECGERPEPAPDGGTVTLDGPLYHCSSCGRTYLVRPAGCAGCGGTAFDRRTAE